MLQLVVMLVTCTGSSFGRCLHNALPLQIAPLVLQIHLAAALEYVPCLVQDLFPLALAQLHISLLV